MRRSELSHIDTRALFDEMSFVYTHIAKVGWFNIKNFLGISELDENEFNLIHQKNLKKIFTSSIFSPDSREWDNRISIKNGDQKIYTPWPVVVANIPDEDNLYCRLHPFEDTHYGDEQIPSRDMIISSYPWRNIFSTFHLKKEIDANKLTKDDINKKIDDLLISNGISNICESQKGKRIVDVCFFGCLLDPSCSYRTCISIDEFKELFINFNQLEKESRNKKLELMAFKFLSNDNDYFSKNSNNKKRSLTPLKNANKPSRTFVIFIDSLDSTLFNNPLITKELVGLNKIYSKSIHFENFTSSADWTYPVLHSMHTGIPPYLTYSNFRHDPQLRNLPIENINDDFFCDKYGVGSHYLSKSLLAKDSVYKSSNFLTRILQRAGKIQGAIKGSTNHGWKYGLIGSTDISFDNCSLEYVAQHFKDLNRIVGDANISTFFIDIDSLHKTDLYTRKNHIKYLSRSTDWIMGSTTREERLLGKAGVHQQIELNRYIDRLRSVDNTLTKILDSVSDNDNVIIFSDHGHHCLPWPEPNSYDIKTSSTMPPAKIWKPTLLVYAPELLTNSETIKSKELVSSTDLFSIILRLNNIFDNDLCPYSLLPLILGGSIERKVAHTFGVTKHAQPKKGQKNNIYPYKYELVERRSYALGTLHSYNAAELPPTNSIHETFRYMFPNAKSSK